MTLNTTTAERVKRIVINSLLTDLHITRHSRLAEDLGADSLDIVEIAMGLEQEFKIHLADSEIKKIVTVGDLIAHAERAK